MGSCHRIMAPFGEPSVLQLLTEANTSDEGEDWVGPRLWLFRPPPSIALREINREVGHGTQKRNLLPTGS